MYKFSALALTTFLTTACITQSVASGLFEEIEVTKPFNLGSSDPNPFEFIGFSVPEGQHIWTAATECFLTMPVVDGAAQLNHVQFTVHAFANEVHPQTLQVFLNDDEVISERKYTDGKPNALDIDVSAGLTDKAMFRFMIPNACKPVVIDSSNGDGRTLGFSFTDAILTYLETVEIVEDESDTLSKKEIMLIAADIATHETEKAVVSVTKKVEKEVGNFVESAEEKLKREGPRTVASVEEKAPVVIDKVTREAGKTVNSAEKKLKKMIGKTKKVKK